ncbi:MAG TPA: response regulator [Gammaproteobacteria bacterium]|nr:response regulator [Gammaproteobacteria bacterium]
MATILLAEDNDLNRDMMSLRLEKSGYQVLLAENGWQCIEQAREQQPGLILMDMDMPVMDGWEATRLLKADKSTGSIPIIALTAHALHEERESALAAGCNDYDVKPVDFERLLEKISLLIQVK